MYLAGTGNSNYSDRVTFAIFNTHDGAPGQQLGGSWTVSAAATTYDLYSIAVTGLRLTADTAYWLVATPTDPNTVVNWSVDPSGHGSFAFGATLNGQTGWDVRTDQQSPSYYEILRRYTGARIDLAGRGGTGRYLICTRKFCSRKENRS